MRASERACWFTLTPVRARAWTAASGWARRRSIVLSNIACSFGLGLRWESTWSARKVSQSCSGVQSFDASAAGEPSGVITMEALEGRAGAARLEEARSSRTSTSSEPCSARSAGSSNPSSVGVSWVGATVGSANGQAQPTKSACGSAFCSMMISSPLSRPRLTNGDFRTVASAA